MALKITSTIGIKKGLIPSSTNEAYIVIDRTETTKAGDIKIIITAFKNQAERNASYTDNQCDVQIPYVYTIVSTGTPLDYQMKLEDYFTLLYAFIKGNLEALGLTVENVI
jgi:hypothetical protein